MRDGRINKCRECESAYKKRWYAENADREQAKRRQYAADHPEEISERNKSYYQRNRDTLRAKNRAYNAREAPRVKQSKLAYYEREKPAILAQCRQYRSTERGRDVMRRAHQNERERFPDHIAARTAVSNAVRDGRLDKPSCCSNCGRSGRIEAHHHLGYEPEHQLDVVWLCPPCHKAADRAQEQHHAQDIQPVAC